MAFSTYIYVNHNKVRINVCLCIPFVIFIFISFYFSTVGNFNQIYSALQPRRKMHMIAVLQYVYISYHPCEPAPYFICIDPECLNVLVDG